MFCRAISILLALPVLASATELIPWYGNDLEIETRATYLFQSYRSVDGSCGKRSSNDHFLTLSALVPYDCWCAELEATWADTCKPSFGWDNFRLTGRYRILDDIIGDCVTLVTGVTLTKAFRPARRDISSFHHGGIEVEGHVTVGQEVSCEQFWTSRWWGVLGLGVGDVGSAWIRGDAAWETNICERHIIRLFGKTLWGLGGRKLCVRKFHGYGSIHHQSIDLGLRYSYWTDLCDITLAVEYSRRVYAKNFPRRADHIMLRLLYPFGL